MKIQLDFNNIKVKEQKKDFTVKILMLKGEKGEQGDLNPSHIVDNLTSNDSSKVLSAKQGKVLKDLVDENTTKINKKPYYFNTVADMKAYNLSAGDMAITKGYYSANDGGGAEYSIVSTTSNYSETLNNNLKAELIIKNSMTPEMFGAYGDGVHDDSLYIQTCLNNSKNVIFNENNNYLISSEIIVPSYIDINGNNCSIIMSSSNINIFNIDNKSNIKIHDFILKNGSYANVFVTTNRPTTNYCYNIEIYNIKYQNTDEVQSGPISLFYIGNCYNLNIHDCNLKGNNETNMCGIIIWSTEKIDNSIVNTDSKYIYIHHNIIDGFYKNIDSLGTSSDISYGSRKEMIISDNYILNAVDTGINAYHSPNCMIKNNYVIDCKKGCWSDNGLLTEGNYFLRGEIGFWTEEFVNGIINNNIFDSLTNTGILIGGGTLISNIDNNTFRYCNKAITIDEQYTPNKYYSGNLNIQNNKFTSIYNNILDLKFASHTINFSNNFISVWGLESETPIYAIKFNERNITALYINDNIFENISYSNSQPSSIGNCAGILNTNNHHADYLFMNNNKIIGEMQYLAIIKVSMYFYFLNNIFQTPSIGLLQLSAQNYARKYVIKDNINLSGANTLPDASGGTTL